MNFRVQVPISEGSNTPAYENVCVYPGRSEKHEISLQNLLGENRWSIRVS